MQTAPRLRLPSAIPWLLFAGALALRMYGLNKDPLWYDELHGYEIARLGLQAVLSNSLDELHPPLYYLLQWGAAGLGGIHEAWAWRWIPAFSGALAVVVVYALARRIAGTRSAMVAAALLAISATPYYFSQEARGYAFVLLLSGLSMRLVYQLLARPDCPGLWVSYAAVTAVGIASEYSYVFVPAIQIPYLALALPRRRGLYVTTAALTVAALPLLGVVQVFTRWSGLRAHLAPLGLAHTAQTLVAWETARYAADWPCYVLPVVFAVLAALGLWPALRRGAWRDFTVYAAAQVILPPAAFFLIGTRMLDVRLPIYEGKQFMVVLPALYVLVAAGLQSAARVRPRALGGLLALTAIGVIAAGSLVGLSRYWGQSKNPEGQAVLALRDTLQGGDAVVSLHYRIDYALEFYVRDAPEVAPALRPAYYPSDLVVYTPVVDPATIAAIRNHPRIWLLAVPSSPADVYRELVQGCTLDSREESPDVTVVRAVACPP